MAMFASLHGDFAVYFTLGPTMNPRITLRKVWNDDDVIELTVEVSDGKSMFSNNVYVATHAIEELTKNLTAFREHVYGGLYDIRFGEFGPEYANGAFQARLHFHIPGRLFISTHQQSDFEEFSKTQVASEAKMYLKTEPILLDNFISELKALNSGESNEATLVGA
jgi:hypothetical protein